jgi:hypothetical protein
MIVRQSFDILPPKEFLMQAMDAVTRVYCFLWDEKDINNRVNISWDEVRKQYSKNTFRTSLRKLNNLGLISYLESKEIVRVELVDWNDVSDDE